MRTPHRPNLALLALSVTLGLAAAPGLAHAGTLRTNHPTPNVRVTIFNALPGEANQLTVSDTASGPLVADDGAPETIDPSAATTCSPVNPHIARCADPFVSAVLGDGNDTLRVSGSAFRVYANGGDGNDVLTRDGGPAVFVGGPGNDVLSGGDGNTVLDGGPGDDVFAPRSRQTRLYCEQGLDRVDLTNAQAVWIPRNCERVTVGKTELTRGRLVGGRFVLSVLTLGSRPPVTLSLGSPEGGIYSRARVTRAGTVSLPLGRDGLRAVRVHHRLELRLTGRPNGYYHDSDEAAWRV